MTAGRNLRALQEAFAAALVGGDDGALIGRLAGDPETARRRVVVYRSAMEIHATAALKAAFPVIARLVGEGFFEESARAFLGTTPPTDGNLNRFGDAFPAFLDGYRHAGSLPWLSDVARLEWAWHESLMAGDAEAFDLDALARVPDAAHETLRFEFHPSARLVRSRWPVLAIWEANQPECDGTLGGEAEPESVLVWRQFQRVRLARLSEPEAAFTEGLMAGATLEVASEIPGDWDLPTCLRRLVAHGALCGFRN